MKTELIRSPSTGMKRRTSIGKRWIVIVQKSERDRCDMLTFATRDRAERCNNHLFRAFRPEVHFVERAEVVAE